MSRIPYAARYLIPIAALVALLACEKSAPEQAGRPIQAEAPPPPPVRQIDTWSGLWWGPEGTSLEIAAVVSGYRITIKNLDGPRVFQGAQRDGRIVFERDGTAESIRPASGTETGMKWLADKSNCLVVKSGEGYCRG